MKSTIGLAIVAVLALIGLRFVSFREGTRSVTVAAKSGPALADTRVSARVALNASVKPCRDPSNFVETLLNVRGPRSVIIRETATGTSRRFRVDCDTGKVTGLSS
jgi:hypothetical protein